MESFTPSAAAAADPSQAPLDQASFTEMFHSSPAATPADTGERFRNPAGQFAPRNLNKTELPATEPRPAVELVFIPALEGEKPVEPLPKEECPAAAGAFVREKKKGGIALRYAARTTAQNRGGAIEDAAASVPVIGTLASLPYENKFADLSMLVNEMIKKDSSFKSQCEEFQKQFEELYGPKLTAAVSKFHQQVLKDMYKFDDEQSSAALALIATKKSRGGVPDRKNAEMLIVFFRRYLATDDSKVAEFILTASQGILPTETSGVIDISVDRIGIGRLEKCWTTAGFADVWDDLHLCWVDMFESFRPQTISPQAAKAAYFLVSANSGQSSRPQDQIIHTDLTVESMGSWVVRDAALQEVMINAGLASNVDLSLRIFEQCKQATFAMHPDVRSLMKSLLSKQDDMDPHRIKLVDGIPNCPDAECLQRLLNRTQKVWNDFGGKKVTKPAAKAADKKDDDKGKAAPAAKKKKVCRHWKKTGACKYGDASGCRDGLHSEPEAAAAPAAAKAAAPAAAGALPAPKAPATGVTLTTVPCQHEGCTAKLQYDKAGYAAKKDANGNPNPWSEPKWCPEHKQKRAADGSFLCIGEDDAEDVDSDEELRRSLAAGEVCDFELEAHSPANLMLDVQVDDTNVRVDDAAARCPTAIEVADAVLFLCTTPAMQDISGFVHTKAVSSIQAQIETALASSDDFNLDNLVQGFEVDCDDLMPYQYEEAELIQVFQHLLEAHCKWTEKSRTDWSYVFSHYDISVVIIQQLNMQDSIIPDLMMQSQRRRSPVVSRMANRILSQSGDFEGWTVKSSDEMVKKASFKAASILSSILKIPEKVRLAHLGTLSVKSLCKNSGKYLSKSCLASPGTRFTGQTVDYDDLADELTTMIEWAVEEELNDALDVLSVYSDQKFTSAFRGTCTVMKVSMADAAKCDERLADIRTLVGRQKSITEAFAAAAKTNTDEQCTRKISVMVRDCDGLVIAANSPGGFVTAPACLVPRLTGNPVADMELTHCAASELLTTILRFEVLPDHIDPADGPSSPGEPVRFVCQLDCSAADLVHHPRWMWLPKVTWFETACLAVEFRRGLDDLNADFDLLSPTGATENASASEVCAAGAFVSPENDNSVGSSGRVADASVSPMPADHQEWVNRTLNAAHGVWITDRRRKSKRERMEIKRLVQSPTGMQKDRYESGASGTDEDDIRSPDFR